ncbi:hypothetical protein [Methanosarcina sp. UBA5]|nr:hypothetical protein [Methanosarcina sp. UBA5]
MQGATRINKRSGRRKELPLFLDEVCTISSFLNTRDLNRCL